MKRYVSTSLIVVVVIALVVLIGAGVAVTATDLSPTGLKVNGHVTSQQDINDDLDSIAHSGQLDQTTQSAEGAVSGTVSSGWLTRLAQTRVLLDVLHRRGITLTDTARARLEKSAGGQLEGLSSSVKRTLLDYNLGLQLLQDKVGQDGVSSAMGRALKRAHVTVDPRYGRWNAKRAIVCAPSGCPPASPSGG
jgi:hypothetical protein